MNSYLKRFIKFVGFYIFILGSQFIFTIWDTTLDGVMSLGFPKIFWVFGGLPPFNNLSVDNLKIDLIFFAIVCFVYVVLLNRGENNNAI